MARLASYCTCGAALTGHANPDSTAQGLTAAFRAVHNEPGCTPATAAQAHNARRRAKRAEHSGTEAGQ